MILPDIARSGVGDLKIYRCGDNEYVGDLETRTVAYCIDYGRN
jgi:hypothetical protein